VNEQILAYLPVLSPVVTLIVVYIGVLAQNRHVDVRVSDLQRYIDQRFTDTVARLEALIRAETGDLLNRIERLESERRVIDEGGARGSCSGHAHSAREVRTREFVLALPGL
jgi:hypothetical protein